MLAKFWIPVRHPNPNEFYPSMRQRMIRIALHISVRAILLALVLVGVLHKIDQNDDPQTNSNPPKPFIESTLSLDLQLARLFLRTNGHWTDGDRLTLQELYTARGDLDKLAYFSTTSNPTNIESLQQAAKAEIQQGDWSALGNTLNAILAAEPENPLANAWMGYTQIPSDTAIPYLQKAASLPSDEQSLAASILGIVLVNGYSPRDVALRFLENERWSFAERLFTLQLEDNNLDAVSYAYRGFARDQEGRDGYDDIQAAIALEPALPIGYYALGMHHRQREQFDLSLQAFEDAYLLNQQNPALAVEVATAYQLQEEYELAEQWYAVAASLAPDDERFISLQAAFYADTNYEGELDRETIIRKAAQNYPENVSIQTSWARLLFNKKDYKSAEAAFDAAFQAAPSDLRTHFYYAEFLESQGDPSAAIEHYSLVVRSENPFSEKARLALRRLSQ